MDFLKKGFGCWWVVVSVGGYILAGGGWWWIYFGWWWVMVGGGGYILAGGGLLWMVVGGGGRWVVVALFSITRYQMFYVIKDKSLISFILQKFTDLLSIEQNFYV